MDNFIQDGLNLSIENHYCRAYIVKEDSSDDVVALFALSFDSLDLDMDDKADMMSGISSSNPPLLSSDYKDIFLNKPHYPALEIAYLAVDKSCAHQGLGSFLIEVIIQKAQEQNLAGCQFLTVEALSTSDYSAVGFYEKCGFSPCEFPNPNKGTLRMFRTVYPVTVVEET